jgi:hypothetical protein
MNHLKGATYASHLKEKEDKTKDNLQMKAAEKASQADSRRAHADLSSILEIEEDNASTDAEVGVVPKKKKRTIAKKTKTAGAVLAMAPTPSKKSVEHREHQVAIVPAVPPEKKRPGSEEVPSATDKTFCKHYCVQDLVTTPCCYLTKRQNDHYASKGNYLWGVSCKQCATPAIEVKKQANAMLGNVAFLCEMGQKAFMVHEDSRHLPYYTSRVCEESYLCYKCAIDMVKEAEEAAGGDVVRSSRRRRLK